jgi:hypothetical protein
MSLGNFKATDSRLLKFLSVVSARPQHGEKKVSGPQNDMNRNVISSGRMSGFVTIP